MRKIYKKINFNDEELEVCISKPDHNYILATCYLIVDRQLFAGRGCSLQGKEEEAIEVMLLDLRKEIENNYSGVYISNIEKNFDNDLKNAKTKQKTAEKLKKQFKL